MLRCLVFSLLALSLQAAPKPNILWLIAEDFGPHLGCYGEAQVQTPHLDGLAARGMRHERFYTTAPVCSPSRSALNTGMYQTRIGAHNHRSHRDDGFTLPAGVQLLSQRLRAAGYFTANLKQLPKPADFGGSGKTDWNFSHDPKPFDGENWEDLRSHQPFYAQLNFQETHRSFHAPAKVDPAKVKLPPYYPDHEITRRDWAQYLDSAMELDRKVGLVLELLKRDGLADNTIVCFFADNGAAHVRAKQFCYEEGLQVPFILYWPAALNPPADYQAGQVSRRLLLSLDLHAAALDWAGAALPANLDGQVFLGPQAQPPRQVVFGARDRCDETVLRLRSARDERHRYILNLDPGKPLLLPNAYKAQQYPVWNLIGELKASGQLSPEAQTLAIEALPEEELYDLEADPHQLHNLAQSPQHQEIRRRLRAEVEAWMQQTQDQGRQPEPEALVRNQGYRKGMPAKKRAKAAKPKSP